MKFNLIVAERQSNEIGNVVFHDILSCADNGTYVESRIVSVILEKWQ